MTQQNSSSVDNRPKNYLGSSLLFFSIFFTATIEATILFALFWASFEIRYKFGRLWCMLMLWIMKITVGLKYEVEGLENVNPEQAAIIFSNHQSAWETLALRVILPPQSAVIKRELLYLPLWGWSLLLLKSIVIDKRNPRGALKSLVKQGTQYLNEGICVLIFPEGTRAAPRDVLPFNAGGSVLAHHSGYPVIPVAHNAGDFWPRYSFFKYAGTIKVKIGAPIETKGRKAAEINAEAEAWIRKAMAEM
ncbi:MAG: lysophospholipid acyltransferase family protein [Methylococcales bacterium]|nr:lysophospholipid acyltransferase family protein [Methylococcales bacterium]MDD5754750.1 lysophospholipid acyltransferase family protein [Methylococcales bacterium]